MKSENIIIFGIFGLGLLLLFAARSSGRRTLSRGTSFNPVWRTESKPEGKRYRNAETWEIKWNEDGLPSKVTIHRDATQT